MSIFSINDNLNYTSILSQSKESKASTNNNTNFSISSKTNSPNYDISSEFKNSIYTLKYKHS
ncbi:hypothetical protein Cjcuy013_04205 [Campylobacter jejuni]|nr:hypothetical protein [Campylobacter jejuni]MBC5860887.1 hypothetical protein [Campylobacter jejuni]